MLFTFLHQLSPPGWWTRTFLIQSIQFKCPGHQFSACVCPIACFLQSTRILSLYIQHWILVFSPFSSSLLLSLTDVPPCVQYCSKCLQPVVILPHLRFKSDLSPSPGNSIYKVCLSMFLFPLLASFTGMKFCRNFIIAFTDYIHPPPPLHSLPATHNEAGLVSQCWPLDFCSVPGCQTSNSDGSFFFLLTLQ